MSSAAPRAAAAVVDVGEADFEREVLEHSRTNPVVVDFWAEWCGPCRALGPVLERLAAEHAGAFRLAKVNVDLAPGPAQRYGVRGIPTVLGFRAGEVVARFVGAQPEPAVREFLAAVLPGEADRLWEEAERFAARGHANAAEERLRAALDCEPRHARAWLSLASLLAERGETQQALEALERIPPAPRIEPEVERLRAALHVRGGGAQDEAGLRARLEAAPGDLEARLGLGRALGAAARYEEALAELLAVVKRDPRFADGAARQAMLDIFAVLGRDHPLCARFRSELARALYR